MTDLSPPRYAAIDIGTNSVLLTIAKGPELTVVEQMSTVTRLGQDVDRTRSLHPDAIDRTLECLRRYRALLDRHGPLAARAVGTSALRDASGGALFTERASEILGFDVEVISGMTEARLTFSGALHGVEVRGNAFVFDIGGGSTELILGHAETGSIDFCTSLDIGSVRLTERLGLSDPPTTSQIEALGRTIAEALSVCPDQLPRPLTVVGVAGTVTTMCALAQGLVDYDSRKVHGYRIELATVQELRDRLAGMTVEERLALPGLTPGRADVIAAGAALCAGILEYSGEEALTVSDRGVRYGVLRELSAEV